MKSAARLQAAVFLWAGVNWVNFRQVEFDEYQGNHPSKSRDIPLRFGGSF